MPEKRGYDASLIEFSTFCHRRDSGAISLRDFVPVSAQASSGKAHLLQYQYGVFSLHTLSRVARQRVREVSPQANFGILSIQF